MLRFGRTHRRPPSQARPYLVRLVVFMGLSLLAIVMLRWQSQEWQSAGGNELGLHDRAPVEDALTPSSAHGLPDGVFIAGLRSGRLVDTQDLTDSPSPSNSTHEDILAVDKQLMAGVLDKTTRISPRAYYHLVDLAARTSPAVLEQRAKSEQEITLAHLATEPDKYRGELIYLKGRLRGLVRFDATKDVKLNPTGLVDLYQGDLFTPQAHPYPYVLIMPSVPEGMPQGMDLSENVTFVGFFLQLWRYQAPGRIDRVAPVLVGRMLTWTPAPKADSGSHMGAYLAIAIVLLMVGLGTSVWALNRRTTRAFRVRGGIPSDPNTIKAELARLERHETRAEVDNGQT